MASADRVLPLQSDGQAFLKLRTLAQSLFHRCAAIIDRLPSWLFTRLTQYLLDGGCCAAAIYVAYQLRFDGNVPLNHTRFMWIWIALLPTLRIVTLHVSGGYEGIWRYFDLNDATLVVVAAVPPTALLLALRYGLRRRDSLTSVPVSVIVLELSLFLAFAGGARVFRRVTFEAARRSGVVRKRTLLVGTPDSLAGTLRQVAVYPDVEIAGMLSTERKAHGMKIGGFTVMDEPAALPELLASSGIDLVLIADAGLDSIGAMVATATEFGVEVRLLPSAANVIRGDVRVSVLPKPDETILDRAATTHSTPHPAVVEAFRGRTVLVTGAGGSIGSELCRQIFALPVTKLVLFDHDENSIFEIHAELASRVNGPRLVPAVGDIRNRDRLDSLFAEHRPHIVLHAAAYKHVPVMEENTCEAVLNNVFGTREVLDAALEFEAERFLMISTDKAVRPSSVMGATKRAAELLVQNRASQLGNAVNTRCACVRFGNVVGSRGSVVPIFLRQIAAGGPVTITNEQMTRYFMTIPEAVQLVIQAATLGSRGDVYMLDMGNPVKIMDLARRLIEMSGMRPGKDIEISVVGTRPGEKIHEQLWYDESRVRATAFPRVFSVHASDVPYDFEDGLQRLEDAAQARDDRIVRDYLQQLPIDFAPMRMAPPLRLEPVQSQAAHV